MYHSQVLEDVLDIINLCKADPRRKNQNALPVLNSYAGKALGWLGAIVGEDGNIPLLNDSAYGITPGYKEIEKYAGSLGVKENQSAIETYTFGSWSGRNLSGYWSLKHGPLRLLFDTAALGPNYIPGHAHCDMLSMLFDFEGRSIFTDTGVYEYAEGERRHYSRGTSAHNTVVLDGLEQAELWKSFRVGRRGYPKGFGLDRHHIRCGHTGFSIRKRNLYHEREINLPDSGFRITDSVRGPGVHHFKSFFHFAPGLHIETRADDSIVVENKFILKPWGAEASVTQSEYYPEFGRAESRTCLVLQGRFNQSARFGLQCISCS